MDEAHAYRGAFGTHCALVLRRLRRLCAGLYGAQPQFFFSSATVANPRQHVQELARARRCHVACSCSCDSNCNCN